VAGRVGRAHVVPVRRPRGEASAVAISGGSGGRDLGEPGRAPRTRAALHQIVLDRDVVVRGGPGEVDLTRRGTAGGEPSGHTRRLGIRRQRRTAHGARIGAHVAGRIGRTHAVPEGRPRGEADVAEARGGGGPDLEDTAGAPRIRAVIHQIVLDRDVVVRGGPGEVDLTRRGTGGAEPSGHTRRLGIRGGRDPGRSEERRVGIAGSAGRARVVPVGRPRGEASAVAIGGGGGGRDLGEPGRAPRTRAALHQIVLDRDVVVRGGPGEVDLTRGGTGGAEPSGHTRRLGIRDGRDPR